MAKYILYCPECDVDHCITQSVHDALSKVCPHCQKEILRTRLGKVSAFGLTGDKLVERAKDLAKKDIKQLKKGKDKDLLDKVGDSPNKNKFKQ